MGLNAESPTGAVWATKGDTRVTPVGRVMRKYRVDELPQLVNVIRGEMNIVGPRPERPSIFSRLCDDIAEYPMRQRAKPGITGWAQVNHRYDTSVDDVRTKVRYDLEYLRRQGILWRVGRGTFSGVARFRDGLRRYCVARLDRSRDRIATWPVGHRRF